jgi:hypothetical protein
MPGGKVLDAITKLEKNCRELVGEDDWRKREMRIRNLDSLFLSSVPHTDDAEIRRLAIDLIVCRIIWRVDILYPQNLVHQ